MAEVIRKSFLKVCPVVDCTELEEHHHLIENDDKSSVCDGRWGEDSRQRVCCELGPRFQAH